MKYRILYTTSNGFASKLIRWASKRKHESYPDMKIPSHVIYLFHDSIVVDSTIFKGVRTENFHKFKKSNIIVHEEEYEVEDIDNLLDNILSHERDTMYDLWSATYNGLRRVVRRMFGIHLDDDNKWDRENRDYCVELLRYTDEYKHRELNKELPFDLMIEKTGDKYVK